jgi:hypothetical protein
VAVEQEVSARRLDIARAERIPGDAQRLAQPLMNGR